jgi:hypothetical protein
VPARALSPSEREAVLAELHSERFVDCSPAQVWATLLDEGRYLASERTTYRLLAARHGGVRERRNQLTHPPYQRPELLAERPNELWSWDIDPLHRPVHRRGQVVDVGRHHGCDGGGCSGAPAAVKERLEAFAGEVQTQEHFEAATPTPTPT